MAATVNELLEEALTLPADIRANLAEKIVESIETDMDAALEQKHLAEIKRRRHEVLSGEKQILPGDAVLKEARAILNR